MLEKENSAFRTMHRIFEILEILSINPDGLPMKSIMEKLNKPPKSSVYTLLQQMVKKRYVTFMEQDKKYKIGPELIKLSAVIMSEHTIQKHARPAMEKLSKLTGEDTYLGIMDDSGLYYIDKVEGTESIRLNINVGAKRYLHSSCIGKLLLAYLDENEQRRIIEKTGLPAVSKKTITNYDKLLNELSAVKKDGYSITNEESFDGVIGIAAPIRNHLNVVVAGICISIPVQRVTGKQESLIQIVKDCAQEVSSQIGFDKAVDQI